MKLYLVRHGEAQSEDVDPERGLSPRGRREVQKIADHLAELGVAPSVIEHSTKARARQTAALIAEALEASPAVAERDGIAPDDRVDPIADEIAGRKADLMLVGHLPFMPRLAYALVGRDAPSGLAGLAPGGVLFLEGSGQSWTFIRRLLPDDL